MENQEIIENNRLIAEFMGVAPKKIGNTYSYSDGVFFSSNSENEDYVKNSIAEYVKFHTSWDWLMPVVRKVQDITEEPEELESLKYNLWFNDIDGVYNSVIQSIKWYNEDNG